MTQISNETSSHLHVLRNLVEQLIHESQRANLDSLQSFLDDYRDANSTPNREKRNQAAVLDALAFPGMESRQNNMDDAIGDTFEWCVTKDSIPEDHPELNISFREWLATGNGVYHFTGKPGSGKSTLMKFIEKSPETEIQLQAWARADHRRLIRASFFVWKIADAHPLQNKFDGLVRSLLHQILTQVPELIRRVFPSCWRPQDFGALNSHAPKFKLDSDMGALREALRTTLSTRLFDQAKVFLLIDGLDEFNNPQTHSEISREIRSWCDRDHIKICVASREDNAFLNTFSPHQRLRLHLVTMNDVRELTSRRLWEQPHFSTYPKVECGWLIDEIVQTAEGVFLWVVLIIGQLIQLLDDKQDLQDLYNALKKYSKELDEFLKEIIGQIPDSYRDEAAAVFAVTTVAHAHRWHFGYNLGGLDLFCLLQASTIRGCVTTNVITPEPFQSRVLDINQALAQVERFRSRLSTMCKGLVAIQTKPFEMPIPYVTDLGIYQTLIFVHRSVYDLFEFGDLTLFGLDCTTSLVKHGRILLLQSLTRAAEAAPPQSWPEPISNALWRRWYDLLLEVMKYLDYVQESDSISHTEMCFLEALDMSLLRGQRVCCGQRDHTKDLDFLGNLPDNFENSRRLVTVFGTAVRTRQPWYLSWARDRPYYEWLWSHVEWKRYILKVCFYAERSYQPLARPLIEARWISLNDAVEADHLLQYFMPPIRGTLMSHMVVAIISHLSQYGSLSALCGVLRDLDCMLRLENKIGVQGIQFYWWSHPRHSLLRQDATCVLNPAALGTVFGLKMITPDSENGQWIQGLRWSWPSDTNIIRHFITIFGTASGNASLKEFLEQHLKFQEPFFSFMEEFRDGENFEDMQRGIETERQRVVSRNKEIARRIDKCKKLIQAIASLGEAEQLPTVEDSHEEPDNEANVLMDEATISRTSTFGGKMTNKMLKAGLRKQITSLFWAGFPMVFLSCISECCLVVLVWK